MQLRIYVPTSTSMNKSKLDSRKKADPKTDYENLGKMLTNIYESGYINENQSYKSSFLKGIFGGVGGVLGATVVIGLLIWLLSLFTSIPLLGPLTQRIQNTIQNSKK